MLCEPLAEINLPKETHKKMHSLQNAQFQCCDRNIPTTGGNQ